MKPFSHHLTRLYAAFLRLYPRRFRFEFGDEMQVVFNDAVRDAGSSNSARLLVVFLREIFDLPANLIREHWLELVQRKDFAMNGDNEQIGSAKPRSSSIKKEPSSHWEAFVGVLPFLGFGLISMLGAYRPSLYGVYLYLALYIPVLTGLVIGGLTGFPRWSFSYIGWSLLFVWLLLMVRMKGFTVFGVTFTEEPILWRIGVLLFFAIAAGLPLIWKRSFHPLKKLVTGIWHDWPRLSFGLYTFLAWTSLIYDENHHPYLLAFIFASTLATSAGAWFFLRSNTTMGQVLALTFGIVVSHTLSSISYATWDWQSYYGLPPSEPDAWYISALKTLSIAILMGIWMFWPVIVGFMKESEDNPTDTHPDFTENSRI